jgi:hypothetical protein
MVILKILERNNDPPRRNLVGSLRSSHEFQTTACVCQPTTKKTKKTAAAAAEAVEIN